MYPALFEVYKMNLNCALNRWNTILYADPLQKKLPTWYSSVWNMDSFNLLKPTGHVMHHQFNIQRLYALPTLYLCVLYLSENKQRLVPLTA